MPPPHDILKRHSFHFRTNSIPFPNSSDPRSFFLSFPQVKPTLLSRHRSLVVFILHLNSYLLRHFFFFIFNF
ncbi:hypothetical protein RIF29_38270 [Crotalaria pallida]|uniref:Uncharacterized protein n=1 Tax=Crotalaria pallida TaxID=3830 RepID=A0AAN9E1Y0_CROPI